MYTNGTRRIPDDIGNRLHISLWGADETSELTRGADVNAKALRNYAHDPRALFVYTINALNIGEIMPLVRACRDHGVQMTFNYFSPTETYLAELKAEAAARTDFFRFSDAGRNLILSPDDFARARSVIEQAMDHYPETVVYSLAYDDWITRDGVYDLDENGVARNCSNRIDDMHRAFLVDQSQSQLKCSNPTIDCSECRTYVSSMASYIRNERRQILRRQGRSNWTEVFACWQDIFIGQQWDRLDAHIEGQLAESL